MTKKASDKKQVKIVKNHLHKPPTILVCPLDWGLGHATRCVPLIRHLIELKCRVIIAGSGRSLDFLKQEFPDCDSVYLPSYRFVYGKSIRMSLAMLFSLPMILMGIIKEHILLKKIIRQHCIDGVISDNRFGLWYRELPCVYMTHQVKIKAGKNLKMVEHLFYRLHKSFISKYNMLWIPDVAEAPSLSGELAHGFELKTCHKFIGPLSRFELTANHKAVPDETFVADVLVIISGPEPQRSIFESIIIGQAKSVKKKIIILQGLPGKGSDPILKDNMVIYPHLETPLLEMMIKKAGLVICRPGYSSVMDLAALGKKAFFVPTPGQTEQEYLAEYFSRQGIAAFQPQKRFRLVEAISFAPGFSGFEPDRYATKSFDAVKSFVDEVCNKQKLK